MRLILTALLFSLASCVSTGSIPLTDQGFPPRPKDYPIAVFAAGAELSRPYIELARLTGNGSHSANWNAVHKSMAIRDRLIGADALLLEDSYTTKTGSTHSGGWYSSTSTDIRSKHIKATAIRWTDAQADVDNAAEVVAYQIAAEQAAIEDSEIASKSNWTRKPDSQ